MSNAGSIGRRDFRASGDEELVGASTSAIEWKPGDGDKTFGDPAAGDDYLIPRFITCNVGGTLVCKGHHADDVNITRNLLAGQVLSFRPKTFTASGSTAEVILEY